MLDDVVRWKFCSFIWGAAGMGDRVHFSLNGIFTGFFFFRHCFYIFFCLKDLTSSAILTEIFFLCECVCLCLCVCARVCVYIWKLVRKSIAPFYWREANGWLLKSHTGSGLLMEEGVSVLQLFCKLAPLKVAYFKHWVYRCIQVNMSHQKVFSLLFNLVSSSAFFRALFFV